MEKAAYEQELVKLAQEGKLQELLVLAKKLVEDYPSWHIAWHYLAVAYGLQNDHERAISYFIKVLELKPHSVKALYGLSVSFHALKMYEEDRKSVV